MLIAHALGVGCAASPVGVGPGADSDWKARGLRTWDGRAGAWAWAFGPRVLPQGNFVFQAVFGIGLKLVIVWCIYMCAGPSSSPIATHVGPAAHSGCVLGRHTNEVARDRCQWPWRRSDRAYPKLLRLGFIEFGLPGAAGPGKAQGEVIKCT